MSKRDNSEVVSSSDAPPAKRIRKSRFTNAPVVSASLAASMVAARVAGGTSLIGQMAPTTQVITPSIQALTQNIGLSADAMNKARAAAALQMSIAKQLAEAKKAVELAKARRKPKLLLFDSLGREIDEEGSLVNSKIEKISTLKINRDGGERGRKKINPYLAHNYHNLQASNEDDDNDDTAAIEDEGTIDAANFFDDSIHVRRRFKRRDKLLNFVEEGRFVEEEEKAILKAARQEVIDRIKTGKEAVAAAYENAAKTTTKMDNDDTMEVENDNDDKTKTINRLLLPLESNDTNEFTQQPDIEWWDQEFLNEEMRSKLKDKNEDTSGLKLSYKDISFDNNQFISLVHHPLLIKVATKVQPTTFSMMLTKKERKRIRRKSRMEREREKQDLIRIGLIPKEQAKLKLSNLMKVLKDEAVAAPSAMEAKVREQIADRLQIHNMSNLSRKLTPGERREKKIKKLQEDTALEIHALLFRVDDLSSPQKRFKVEMNAKQYNMTGCVVVCASERCCMVYVEGGPKGIRKYKRLMEHRIKWVKDNDESDDESSDGDEDAPQKSSLPNRCSLAWEGAVPRRYFNGFTLEVCGTSDVAREHLAKKGCPHYWDQVLALH